MNNNESPDAAPTRLPPKLEEQALLEVAGEVPGARIVSTSTGRSQAAEALAAARPEAMVTAWYLDSFHASAARQHAQPLPNLTFACQADAPAGEFEIGLVPTSASGEAELVRDLIQSIYDRLTIGGQLVASVDNPRDRWLHDLLKGYEKSVKVRTIDGATVYRLEKTQPLKKLKDYRCRLAFKDCDTLIQLVTRPGVFSHRQLDNGARQLLDAVDVFPEARLLDIGCGSGAVALGLAARDASASVHAIDANARAVACTLEGATLNGLENLTAAVDHDGSSLPSDAFDMALANPPYFADFRIAQHFMNTASHALRKGGRLVLVTKRPSWFQENLPLQFEDCEVYESGRYWIASGIKP